MKDGKKLWVCVEHYEKAFPAQTSKELYEELYPNVRFQVQPVQESPCRYCNGKNGRS